MTFSAEFLEELCLKLEKTFYEKTKFTTAWCFDASLISVKYNCSYATH